MEMKLFNYLRELTGTILVLTYDKKALGMDITPLAA
jgi:hypothetical protein